MMKTWSQNAYTPSLARDKRTHELASKTQRKKNYYFVGLIFIESAVSENQP